MQNQKIRSSSHRSINGSIRKIPPPYAAAPPYGWTGYFDSPPNSCLSNPPGPGISNPPVINVDSSSSCYGCTDAACFFNKLKETTDIQSFVEYFLLNELVKDPDGYHKSTFMYKTADTCSSPSFVPGDTCSDADIVPGKVFAGPLWDKNKSYGNYGGSVATPCGVTSSTWAECDRVSVLRTILRPGTLVVECLPHFRRFQNHGA